MSDPGIFDAGLAPAPGRPTEVSGWLLRPVSEFRGLGFRDEGLGFRVSELRV